MIKCENCYLNKIFESDDERKRCLHRETCERAYQQGRADAIKPIEKELYHWEDWILAESPTGYHDVKEYSADDMQRMICRTIRECKEVIEKLIKEQKNDTRIKDTSRVFQKSYKSAQDI